MKENKYDDPAFFEEYARLPRSIVGPSQSAEWHAFRGLLPGLHGKRVLDLGCGFGWHCRYARQSKGRVRWSESTCRRRCLRERARRRAIRP